MNAKSYIFFTYLYKVVGRTVQLSLFCEPFSTSNFYLGVQKYLLYIPGNISPLIVVALFGSFETNNDDCF